MLPHTRRPLDAEDREALRTAFAASLVAGGIFGGVALIGLVIALVYAVGHLDDVFSAGIGFFFASILTVMLVVAVYVVRRGLANRSATEKLVYVAMVTGKRLDRSSNEVPRGPGETQTASHVSQVLVLDGVDFRVGAHLYAAVEPGQRVELYCLPDGEAFRVVRV